VVEETREPLPPWTLVTSHGLVLLYVTSNPDATIREISDAIELTERRVADIIQDLSRARLVEISRVGRRNHYRLTPDVRFRHPYVANIPFEAFVGLWRVSRGESEAQDGHS
jgi:hypothetical protein